MRKRNKHQAKRIRYWLLTAVALAAIVLCFILPSLIFDVVDTQLVQGHVRQVSNQSNGLTITTLSLMEKIQILNRIMTFDGEEAEVISEISGDKDEAEVTEMVVDGLFELFGTEICENLMGFSDNRDENAEYMDYRCLMITDPDSSRAYAVWEISCTFNYDGLFFDFMVWMDDESQKILFTGFTCWDPWSVAEYLCQLMISNGSLPEDATVQEALIAEEEPEVSADAELETKALEPDSYSEKEIYLRRFVEYLGFEVEEGYFIEEGYFTDGDKLGLTVTDHSDSFVIWIEMDDAYYITITTFGFDS